MKSSSTSMQASLLGLVSRQLPRVLTQACRNPASCTFGCFDRNWWHYKVRDFPSIILQQGAYMLATARASGIAAKVGVGDTQELEAAAIRFWILRALRYGAFEEYYPWERGYPPLAFSTLVVAKMLAADHSDSIKEAGQALKIAARQLVSRFEGQASNQQVAGLAALFWMKRIDDALVSEWELETLLERTLALQVDEGWFWEYGGPDLGYLSVTIDCMWDVFDATGDRRVIDAIHKAVVWTHRFIVGARGNIGMHNSRNTDYLVPYGFVRMAAEAASGSKEAHEIFSCICTGLDEARHPLAAVDDRYWCHYIGHSVVRALEAVEKNALDFIPTSVPRAFSSWSSGLRVVPLKGGCTLIVSASKGGNATIHDTRGKTLWCDFGWHIRDGNLFGTMNWQSERWLVSSGDCEVSITGRFVEYRIPAVTPLRHMLLRFASFFLGPKLIKALKGAFIFHRRNLPWSVERIVSWSEEHVSILDKIRGAEPTASFSLAARSSSRHVASADSYHDEDLMRGAKARLVRRSPDGVQEFRVNILVNDLLQQK